MLNTERARLNISFQWVVVVLALPAGGDEGGGSSGAAVTAAVEAGIGAYKV